MSSENNGHYKVGQATHIGKRESQQDSLHAEITPDGMVAAVFDGMGGMQGGELASGLAMKIFFEDYKNRKDSESVYEFLEETAFKMDKAVRNIRSEDGGLLDAGTTIAAAYIDQNRLHWLSVGDSRIYILRGDEIQQVNREHNYRLMLHKMLQNGEITPDEYQGKSKEESAEYLISFLGIGGLQVMDLNEQPFELEDEDIIVLCSDGLYRALSDIEIRTLIKANAEDMQKAAETLIDQTVQMELKNQDNTSVILLQYHK